MPVDVLANTCQKKKCSFTPGIKHNRIFDIWDCDILWWHFKHNYTRVFQNFTIPKPSECRETVQKCFIQHIQSVCSILNTWFRASWFSVNKGPTQCDSMQTFILCHVTLHVSGVMHPSSGALKTVSATSGVRHGNGTVTSFLLGLIRTSPYQAKEEGSNSTITMTYTRGSRYSF